MFFFAPSRELSRRRCSSFSSMAWNGLVCATRPSAFSFFASRAINLARSGESPILDLEVGRRARSLAAEDTHRTVRQPHGQATDGESVEGFENEARGERHAVGRGSASHELRRWRGLAI